MNALASALARLGAAVTAGVWRLGYASRFFGYLLLHSGTAFRRFHLTMREIYFAGVLSLIIILVSGMFVGMVLALQGYETLQRYGSSEALGILVALSLVRELGPVVAGLLFSSRAGSAPTSRTKPFSAPYRPCSSAFPASASVARGWPGTKPSPP